MRTLLIRRLPAGALAAGTMFAALSVLLAPAASADPSYGDWDTLRQCESSNNYAINTGNGYYGAYQFDQATWNSVGGTGRPDLNSPAEQDYRALYLYRTRGWQPWTCAAINGLQEDSDAASGRIPTYDESAYIGGSGAPTPPPPPPPPPAPTDPSAWPGEVYVYGDCDADLATWQLQMNAYGYGFTGTGCYYDKTQTAVLDLQLANGITASGTLGPLTWDAAWHGTPPAPTEPPAPTPPPTAVPAWPGEVYEYGVCDADLSTWQLRMNVYGYDFSGTGCYYDETQTAVLDLQRANGINPSGILGPLTWDAAWTGVAPR